MQDFGSANCMLGANGRCDMGESSIAAGATLNSFYGVPFTSIALTPMVGQNDIVEEVFTLADVTKITKYAVSKGMPSIHFWAYDRDMDCTGGATALYLCHHVSGAGPLGFTNEFLKALGGPVAPPQTGEPQEEWEVEDRRW